jgi:hypothetical protein
MAQNLVVNFIGNNKLSKTTSVISNDLKKFQKTTDSVGKSLTKAFGAVGLGVGIYALANGLKQATKAASDDRKSQALLALALQNTVGATSQAIAGAEQYIKKTQLSSAVLDDELRPALAKAVGATGDLAKGQRILDIALDISAQTGAGLEQTTKALSLAYNGNTASLKKLVPGLKITKDVIADVEKRFQGASETAANLDPYKRLEVIFADLQETVGMALLPALDEFSKYLASPEGQANLQQIVTLFVSIGHAITDATKFLIANMGAIKAIIATLVFLRVGWALSTTAVKLYMLATNNAVKATKFLRVALLSTGIGAVILGVGLLAEQWMTATDAKEDYYYVQPTNVNSGEFDYTQVTFPGQIPESSDAWRRLGFEMYGAYVQSLADAAAKDKKKKAIIAEDSKKLRDAMNKEMEKMKSTAEKFRDAVGIAFGARGQDENTIFNVDFLLNKLRRISQAAKGFAQNIAKINKLPGGQAVSDQLIAMGPAAGNIAAKALLASPTKLAEIVGLQGSLYTTGAQAQAQQLVAGNASYEININKAVVSASDIIREIRIFEKKTGRKYLVG